MSSWAVKRQVSYAVLVLGVLGLLIGGGLYLHFKKQPTCTDNLMNGDETGVDCGGKCPRFCPAEASPLIIRWFRLFPSNPGYWNVVAYIENPNQRASARNVPYTFKVYDKDGVPIGDKSGYLTLPPNAIQPIFESYVSVGKHEPVRVTFEFLNDPDWYQEQQQAPFLTASEPQLTTPDTAPRVTATISNSALQDAKNVEVIALVYDTDGNAIAASRTFLDTVPSRGSADAVFTWRQPFAVPVSRVEVVPRAAALQSSSVPQ